MTTESPTIPAPEQGQPASRSRFVRPPYPNALGLLAFVILAVGVGGTAALASLVGLSWAWLGRLADNSAWSIWIGLGGFLLGAASVVGGVAMWRRRAWGWWLMLGVVSALIVSFGGFVAFQLLMILAWLWGLRALLVDPYQSLEPDLDGIATALGIDWRSSPLVQIGELVAASDRRAAARLYREHFGCTWDEAHAAISHWPTERVANKLRHMARLVAGSRSGAQETGTPDSNRPVTPTVVESYSAISN